MATKKSSKGAAKTGGMGSGNSDIYGLMSRREICTTGGTYLCTNSHELGDYVPKSNLPEEVVDIRYTKRGEVKVKRESANAEKVFVSNARRHQMRLSTHMDSGTRSKRDQNGKFPSGPAVRNVMSGGGLY